MFIILRISWHSRYIFYFLFHDCIFASAGGKDVLNSNSIIETLEGLRSHKEEIVRSKVEETIVLLN